MASKSLLYVKNNFIVSWSMITYFFFVDIQDNSEREIIEQQIRNYNNNVDGMWQ
jgi:hypothetical protein